MCELHPDEPWTHHLNLAEACGVAMPCSNHLSVVVGERTPPRRTPDPPTAGTLATEGSGGAHRVTGTRNGRRWVTSAGAVTASGHAFRPFGLLSVRAGRSC